MAELRVFVSSTCYDLSLLRSQLRAFITDLGYVPVMSDYADVLYDPRTHTHTSCLNEVNNCDILILIIGSRFGGKASIEALNNIDFDALKDASKSSDSFKEKDSLSITHLEVLKAIEHNIPVYTFIDKRIWHDHELYEKNKTKEIINQITFPSIEKQETAKYIFNFINFIRLRAKGNNIFPFEKGQDIEETLRKQWAGYFQRLLQEQRFADANQKRIDVLSEQFEVLKTAILSSIENTNQRETASGIVRYKRVADFLFGLGFSVQELKNRDCEFDVLLKEKEIVDILEPRSISYPKERGPSPRSILVKYDGTFYEARIPIYRFDELKEEWASFKEMKPTVKEIVLETLQELIGPVFIVRYRNIHIEDYISKGTPREVDPIIIQRVDGAKYASEPT